MINVRKSKGNHSAAQPTATSVDGIGRDRAPEGGAVALAAAGFERLGWLRRPDARGAHTGDGAMTRSGLAAVALPLVVLAACQRPAPEPPAPVVSPGEAACAAQAAQVAGVDPATVTVVPTATTKSGATIYTATVGETDYTCVVELDSTISTFEVVAG
jgi:hypothetical protein